MIAAIFGQLWELTEARNWEQTDGITVAETIAAWDSVYQAFTAQAECSSGGGGGMILHQDITLAVDTTQIVLTNLHTLSGRDLLIRMTAQNTTTAQRDLLITVNGVTTVSYERSWAKLSGGTTYGNDSTDNEIPVAGALQDASDDGDEWSHIDISIPIWKETNFYPNVLVTYKSRLSNGIANGVLKQTAAVSTIELSSNSGDISAGSRIAIYGLGI
jgi:hypothetical protein